MSGNVTAVGLSVCLFLSFVCVVYPSLLPLVDTDCSEGVVCMIVLWWLCICAECECVRLDCRCDHKYI